MSVITILIVSVSENAFPSLTVTFSAHVVTAAVSKSKYGTVVILPSGKTT